MTIAKDYIEGLRKAYEDCGAKEKWEHFKKIIHGANQQNMMQLKEMYPDIPCSLIELLEFVDGTYWRKYHNETIAFYFLGSDLGDYAYYLLSSQEMIEHYHYIKDHYFYEEYIDRKFEDIYVDERIIDCSKEVKWLHFSDCMNNGGTSQLFIDFSPSIKGSKGQIVRYLHDPDELEVIADSFDEYLEMLMNHYSDFINEDLIDE